MPIASLGDKKGIMPIKTCATYPQKFLSGTTKGRKLAWNWFTQVHKENS